MIINREIESVLRKSLDSFSSVTVTGPRQSGKTTLVKKLFPDAPYYSFENPDIRRLAIEDPRDFIAGDSPLSIYDEIQHVPELLSYLQEVIDAGKRKFIFTGSNQFSLLESVNQSLAGRTAMFTLLPFSFNELGRFPGSFSVNDRLFRGFYPAVYGKNQDPNLTYRSYYNTYIERDVRKLINIKDLSNYQKFIQICAGRIGQVLNMNSISNEIGVSAHTIKSWLSTLEASYIVFLLQPFHKNINKRLVKSPKLYFYDVGLARYILGIEKEDQLHRDPLYGALFENMVVSEIIKSRMNEGLTSNIFFYRDSNMNEIDIVQKSGSAYRLFEIKSASTFHSGFIKNMIHFEKTIDSNIIDKTCLYNGETLPSIHGASIVNVLDFFQ